MFKKQLKYEIKQILPIAGIISAIELLLLIINGQTIVSLLYASGFLFIPFIIVILTVTQFKFMMDRRSTDLFYSLPLTRFELYLSKLLSGMIALTIINLVHIFGLFIATIDGYSPNSTLILVNVLMSFLSLGIYAYTTFIFSRAHSIVDGLIFIAGHVLLIPAILVIVLSIYEFSFLRSLSSSLNFIYLGLFGSLQYLTQAGEDIYHINRVYNALGDMILTNIILFLNPLLGFLSILFVYKTERNRKLEDVEDLSHSLLGYKVLIPIYAITLSSFIAMVGIERMFYIFVGILIYIGYAIYYRTMRLPSKAWIMVMIVFIVSVIWMYVM